MMAWSSTSFLLSSSAREGGVGEITGEGGGEILVG